MNRKLIFIFLMFTALTHHAHALTEHEIQAVLKSHTFAPGVTIWDIMAELQDMLTNAHNLINSLTTSVGIVDAKSDDVVALVDYIAKESARRIELVFNKVQEIQSQTGGKLQEVATYLQHVAVESSRQLQEVMMRANEIGASAASRLDNLDVETIASIVDTLGNKVEIIEQAGTNVVETLNAVKKNGSCIAEILHAVDNNKNLLHSTIDQLSNCCTELSENDAKIFSAVERIETHLATVPRTIERNSLVELPTQPHHQVRFLKNDHLNRVGGISITEPGLYIVTESLNIDTVKGITIEANNVTLDLNGFTLSVDCCKTTPITIRGSDNILIKNGTITGGKGIAIIKANGVALEKLTLTHTLDNALHISTSHNTFLRNCIIREATYNGIAIDAESSTLMIEQCTITDCQGHGITVANSKNIHIAHTILDNNGSSGIIINDSVEHAHVESCRAMGNGSMGFVDKGASFATWMNNLASGNAYGDYENIKAVLQSKATSFWHNVYAN